MSLVLNEYTGDGVTTTFNFSMEGGYLSREFVVFLTRPNDKLLEYSPYTGSVTWLSDFSVRVSDPIPAGTTFVITRRTTATALVDFQNTSRITERNLDTAFGQSLHRTAELEDVTARRVLASTLLAEEAVEAAQDAADAAVVSAANAATAASLVGAANAAAAASAASASEAASNAEAATDTADAALALIQQAVKGNVDSFNGRDGAVLPQQGDYTPDMVGFDTAGVLSTVADFSPVPAWSDPMLNAQAQALANRSELLLDNQKRTPLHFATLADASAAAATLPDGQVVDVIEDGKRYVVAAGAAVFLGYTQSYRGGSVSAVLDGYQPFGFTGSTVDPKQGDGPLIARPWCTTADLILFVDPVVGNDSGPGTLGQPLKTITAAMQRVPQNIYHKVRIYLLDGDYGNEQIKALNYFVTARGTAGFRIVGHCAGFDGEAHPVYTDDDPSKVKVNGIEHLFSGIAGTEEMYVMGITFTGCWVETYDACMWFHKCRFVGGMSQPGYAARHALGGHYFNANFTNCDFVNLAMIGDFNGHVNVCFEQCTLSGLHMTSDARLPGRPFIAGNLTTIYIKDSPTLLAAGPGGKSISGNGGVIADYIYSPIGYQNIRRASPQRNEILGLLGHDGSGKNSGRGAGIFLHGANESSSPGSMDIEIGSNQFATWGVRHFSNSTLADKKLLSTNFYGELNSLGCVVFGGLARAAASFLQNGQGCFYTDTAGDVFVLSRKDGVTKYTKLLNYATATPL